MLTLEQIEDIKAAGRAESSLRPNPPPAPEYRKVVTVSPGGGCIVTTWEVVTEVSL